ncbi:MAG: phage capsid protein, partial [Culicoidibacterales bacterium]
LFMGLNELLKRIEFNVGMSYGTISDPAEIPKTATEIISSKQRLYATVKELQQALEFALDDLVYAMAIWG